MHTIRSADKVQTRNKKKTNRATLFMIDFYAEIYSHSTQIANYVFAIKSTLHNFCTLLECNPV